ncbi:MAG: hypothetical protein ACRC6K_08190 [Fusobacteriaceae bacterium]
MKEIVVTKKGIEVTFCPLFHFVKYSSEFQIYSKVARLDLYEPLKRSMSLKLHKKKGGDIDVISTNISISNSSNNKVIHNRSYTWYNYLHSIKR